MAASPRKIFTSQENVLLDSVYGDRDGDRDAKNEQDQPCPPQPPRSAFMCFTDITKKEILDANSVEESDADILKIVAAKWRELSDRDRAYWDEEARNDKVRYVREKAEYKGPWNLPKRRAKKHPLAPKRPMSAFLKYSQVRRSEVKMSNPDMSNTDVSRLLGEMWRSASPTEKKPYVEQEEAERAEYKEQIKNWREDQAKLDSVCRTSHQSVEYLDEEKTHKSVPSKRDHGRAFVDHSTTVAFAPQPYRPHFVNNSAHTSDRRVFRSFRGVETMMEVTKSYKGEDSMTHPTYDHDGIIPPPPPMIVDRPMFRGSKALPSKARPYENALVDGAKFDSNHHRYHNLSSFPMHYRPPFYYMPENHHHNIAPLNHTGSDISQFEGFPAVDGNSNQEVFAEADPPFNPCQQRPAASHSHYFTESFYKHN